MSDGQKGYLTGLVLGAVFGISVSSLLWHNELQNMLSYYEDDIQSCRDHGFYEYHGEVIKCEVIDKSELIKRSL